MGEVLLLALQRSSGMSFVALVLFSFLADGPDPELDDGR